MSKYKVVRELGRNQEGGRITHLATDTSLDPPINVVIKEFRFAATGANWSGFKAYEREIEILRELKHPRIAKYLDSFETKAGFCLVQEYKNAPSLAEKRSFRPEEIKQIAVSVLEILVYLQKRTPPIIHRDIKPENILVDKAEKGSYWDCIPTAYLIDFGFARIRGGELALSSVAAGTPGFMPPEEQFGRALTEASDLYSLGATLICLLTGTRSVDVGKLIDDDYRFNFKKLVPQLTPRFIAWLEKMVTPNVKQRYANAQVALDALQPIEVVGGATWRESLVGILQSIKPATVLGLATIAIVAVVGATLMISRRDSPTTQVSLLKSLRRQVPLQESLVRQVPLQESLIRQLRQQKKCPKCNLQRADLNGADLNSVDLNGADLYSANLQNASIQYANLQNANLPYAYLQNANLQNANLPYASIQNASIQYANLQNANLQNAYLPYANLQNANLQNANLQNANLIEANLIEANLSKANLSGVKLFKAHMSGVNLSKAHLSKASLSEANLSKANLNGADLNDADLSNTSLYDANLSNANLKRANLKGAALYNTNLEGAKLKGATMPDGRKHP